tara:strand:+ start:1057 stop:1257 length:201 start_codon:yes stop_codon:yes gene_type:complete
MTDSFNAWRTEIASNILYRWACEEITSSEAETQCLRRTNLHVDLYQIYGYVEAFDAETGDRFEIYV